MTKIQYPTVGQLERSLSQRIAAFWRNQLGKQPTKVVCYLFDNKLAVVAENTLTPLESLLNQAQQQLFANEIRAKVNQLLKPELKNLIEEVLQVAVTEILFDTALISGYSGLIAILADSPQVRPSNNQLAKQKQF